MKRRAFITLLGGAAAAWPLAARAQQTAPVVGVIDGGFADPKFMAPFKQGLSDNFIGELAAKRLGLLHELAPASSRIAVLANPTDAMRTGSNVRDLEAAARVLGLQLIVLMASTNEEIDAAFSTIARERADALFVLADSFFATRRVHLAISAARHAVPATYPQRDYAEAGGLMSYGTNLADARRQVGVYTGRILKGEKPADLPVLQPTKFEFIINLQTAKTLGLEIPPTLLARADEVIE